MTGASFENSLQFFHKLVPERKIPSFIKVDRSEMAKLDFLSSQMLYM